MEFIYTYAWLIPVYPLVAAFLLGLGILVFNAWTRANRALAAFLSVFATGTAMVHAFALLASQLKAMRLSSRPLAGLRRAPSPSTWALWWIT